MLRGIREEKAEHDMKSSDNGFDPAFIDEWVNIWNSYDLSTVDDLFLADSRVTYFSSEKEGVIKGIEALRDHHRGFGFVEGGKCQPNRLWLEDIHIEDFGQVAIVTAIWCFQRGSSEKVQKGPVTLVYLPTEKGHKIAHANFANY